MIEIINDEIKYFCCSTPLGLEDVSRYPYLLAELLDSGWSEQNLQKLAGRNLIRVFRQVEDVSVIFILTTLCYNENILTTCSYSNRAKLFRLLTILHF